MSAKNAFGKTSADFSIFFRIPRVTGDEFGATAAAFVTRFVTIVTTGRGVFRAETRPGENVTFAVTFVVTFLLFLLIIDLWKIIIRDDRLLEVRMKT